MQGRYVSWLPLAFSYLSLSEVRVNSFEVFGTGTDCHEI